MGEWCPVRTGGAEHDKDDESGDGISRLDGVPEMASRSTLRRSVVRNLKRSEERCPGGQFSSGSEMTMDARGVLAHRWAPSRVLLRASSMEWVGLTDEYRRPRPNDDVRANKWRVHREISRHESERVTSSWSPCGANRLTRPRSREAGWAASSKRCCSTSLSPGRLDVIH